MGKSHFCTKKTKWHTAALRGFAKSQQVAIRRQQKQHLTRPHIG